MKRREMERKKRSSKEIGKIGGEKTQRKGVKRWRDGGMEREV
jgi:hypothetical protein